MKIGDIVYVVCTTPYGWGTVATEVEVMSDTRMRKMFTKMQTVYTGKPLRHFSFEHGWQSAKEGKHGWPTYSYRVANTRFSKSEALVEINKSLVYAKERANNDVKVATTNLEYAQKAYNNTLKFSADLQNFDTNVFIEKLEPYISPFSGKQI